MENVSETTGLGLGVHVTINPEGCPVLLRDRRAEGHRGLLRPQDLARHRGAEIRLGGQFDRSVGLLAEGRHAQDLQDLSRPDHRQVRLPRHQGPEDRMGNGADGRVVRRGRHHPRRFAAHPDRRRRHHLASERALGGDRRSALRRHRHSRSRRRTSIRSPSCSSTRIRPTNIRSSGSTTITGRSSSTRSSRPDTRSASRRTASSSA